MNDRTQTNNAERGVVTPKRPGTEPALSNNIEALNGDLDVLIGAVDNLEGKLLPISCSDAPFDDMGSPDRNPSSNLTTGVVVTRDKVELLRRRVVYIMDSLEI